MSLLSLSSADHDPTKYAATNSHTTTGTTTGKDDLSSDMEWAHSNDGSIQATLQFSRLELIGRDNERKLLESAFHRLCKASESARTIALISGPSGTGKSALAMSLRSTCLDNHAFFVSGKFDLHHQEPYAGIKIAVAELFQQIRSLPGVVDAADDPRRLAALRQLLSEGLVASSGNDLKTLSNVIPDLLDIIGSTSNEVAVDAAVDTTAVGDKDTVNNERDKPTSSTSISASSATKNSANNEPNQQQQQQSNEQHGAGYREQSDRLKFALRKFVQIICNYCPLVMVMDDVQWADKASLDLLQSWMLDSKNSSLMIVGCYRSNLLDSSDHLKRALQSIRENKRERSIRILDISIDDLSVHHVQEMLIELLSPDPDQDIRGLAAIVHNKTGGNVFFVQQFLQSLVQDHYLLTFDLDQMRWRWNNDEIRIKSAATVNTVEMMKNKLQQLDCARQVLPIAACLGTSFSRRILTVAIRALSIHSDHSAFFKKMFGTPKATTGTPLDVSIREALKMCEKEGLIQSHRQIARKQRLDDSSKHNESSSALLHSSSEHSGVVHHHQYVFIHDKVQEAALALIPQDNLSELQYRVGEVLLAGLPRNELDRRLFGVANLLNTRLDLVPAHDKGNRCMRIAMLNCRAGLQSVSYSAFQPALVYFENAISLLPRDHWTSEFGKSLDIYSAAAECAYINSDLDKMNQFCSPIIDLDCPVVKKVRAYHILIDASLAQAEKDANVDTTTLCLSLLEQLGCKFPKGNVGRTIAMLRGIINLKRTSSAWTLEAVLDLPHSTDPREAAISKTLNKLGMAAAMNSPDLFPLVIMKTVTRISKHGMPEFSPPAFAFQAVIIGYFMGDFEAGRKFANIALQMLKMLETRVTESRTIFIVNSTTLHWSTPMEDLLEQYQDGFRVGMATGDGDSCAWNAYAYLQFYFYLGKPLPGLDAELSTYSKIMIDFHQNNQHRYLTILWQMVHNLRGNSSHPIQLIGDAYDERELPEKPQSCLDVAPILCVKGSKMFLAMHFGEFEIGADILVDTFADRLKQLPGILPILTETFYGGLCCFVMAGTKGCRKKLTYLRMATKCRGKLKEWDKKGNPNCTHHLAILNAEHALLNGKHEKAAVQYNAAIEQARHRNFTQDEALANERLALCLIRGGRKQDARSYYEEAIRLNGEWGATRKVELLESGQQDTWTE